MSFNMRSLSLALRSTPVRPVATRALPARHSGNTSFLSRPVRPAHGLFVSNGATVTAMRHGKKVPKLGLPADQRKALIRSLVTEVIRHGKITTTKVRAKAIRKHVDHMITLAKNGSLHARRQALGFIYDKDLVRVLFDTAPVAYAKRNGGYCSVKAEIRRRRGDNCQMATIELADRDDEIAEREVEAPVPATA